MNNLPEQQQQQQQPTSSSNNARLSHHHGGSPILAGASPNVSSSPPICDPIPGPSPMPFPINYMIPYWMEQQQQQQQQQQQMIQGHPPAPQPPSDKLKHPKASFSGGFPPPGGVIRNYSGATSAVGVPVTGLPVQAPPQTGNRRQPDHLMPPYVPMYAMQPNTFNAQPFYPMQKPQYRNPYMHYGAQPPYHHHQMQQQQQHMVQMQQQHQQMQRQLQMPNANNNHQPTTRKRKPVRRNNFSSDEASDEFQFLTESSSSSQSDVASLEDDSDCAYNRKSSSKSKPARGRPKRNPARATRKPILPVGVATADDDSDTPWLGERLPQTRTKKVTQNYAETSSEESDSSYESNPKKKKQSESLTSRTSRPGKSKKINYANLGNISGLEDELDDVLSDSMVGEGGTGDSTNSPAASKGPSIDRVLGYRRLGSAAAPAEMSITPLALEDDAKVPLTIKDVEFLIKWSDKSHLHNTIEPISTLSSVTGLRKVENFFRRMEVVRTQRLHMTEDEVEQQDIQLELQRQLDSDCLIGERIFAMKEEEEEEGVKSIYYYVKWCGSSYDLATWEKEEVMVDKFPSIVEDFKDREDRLTGPCSSNHPLLSHSLSKTAFEPYTSTPPFLVDGAGVACLREYQVTGINWIISRMKKGVSVLLADEMGLGKTVQSISVIGHMMFTEKIVGPYLVVVPQSTADNWLQEFKRWLPLANVVVYHGNPMARYVVQTHEMSTCEAFCNKESGEGRIRFRFDVCICTPSILNNLDDIEFLRSFDWYLIAIDEAHLLKNKESRRFRELNLFRSRYRLLLSGTPLHNNIVELWTLLHFLSPRIYDDLQAFKSQFSEIERTDSVGELKHQQLTQLQNQLNELVLRRVKRDVEKSLPKKVERILRVELSPKQLQCCEAIISRNYDALAKTSGGSKTSLQNICMELKKACNHPLLLQSDWEISDLSSQRTDVQQSLVHSSGKMLLLDKLLVYLRERKHRVLIFSQMVRMLNLLSRYLTFRGFKHQRLDGTMSREVRKKAMDHFNCAESDDFCFLLSTKAGGLGINLTSADTVVIYDSDWNPQNDLQAEARAHRIGQTKTVQIYRLIAKGSIEEKILERAKAKLVLDTLVVQGLNQKGGSKDVQTTTISAPTPSGFTRDELLRILKFGASSLWRDGPQVDGPDNVNLERILAEAEEKVEEDAAEGLLSSFTNVSDFRYQPPDDLDDKNFWQKTVPASQRKKHAESKLGDSAPEVRKRKRKTLREGVASDDDQDFELSDAAHKKKEKKSSRKAPPANNKTPPPTTTKSSDTKKSSESRKTVVTATPNTTTTSKEKKQRKPPSEKKESAAASVKSEETIKKKSSDKIPKRRKSKETPAADHSSAVVSSAAAPSSSKTESLWED